MVKLGSYSVAFGFMLDMSISCCLSHFSSCLVPNENAVSGEILGIR